LPDKDRKARLAAVDSRSFPDEASLAAQLDTQQRRKLLIATVSLQVLLAWDITFCKPITGHAIERHRRARIVRLWRPQGKANCHRFLVVLCLFRQLNPISSKASPTGLVVGAVFAQSMRFELLETENNKDSIE